MRHAIALAAFCATGALAQSAYSPFDEEALRAYVAQQVAAQGTALTRVEVQVGSPDMRFAPAPCRRSEPFVPAGTRLWGRSSLGLRCVDGASWSFTLPVTVSAWGPALVAASALAAGSVPTAQDVREQDLELTREPPGLLRDVQQLQGRTLVRGLQAGQALRSDMLRATLVVNAGDPVRLRLQGVGFSIAAAGQALGPASEGQPVRVRTELGRVVTGLAREGRTVELAQ